MMSWTPSCQALDRGRCLQSAVGPAAQMAGEEMEVGVVGVSGEKGTSMTVELIA